VDPYEQISLLERLLRDLVDGELPDWPSLLSEEARTLLEGKRDEEGKKRRGIQHSERLIDYTEVTQIQNLITGNYSAFEPALGSKEYVKFYFKRINAFRNPTMHSRPVLAFERQLIEGIVGEFRQQIALYRSEKDPSMNHYPHIEVVTDSFGRSRDRHSLTGVDDKIRVQVGDVIQFQCRGDDPQDRELTWWVREQADSSERDIAIGNEVTLSITITEADVKEYVYVLIYMKSNGKYHKEGDVDETLAFIYAVDPPVTENVD